MAFPVWAALALLFVEYASLSVAFDSASLGLRLDGWMVAGHLGWLAVLAVSGVAGAALVVHADTTSARDLLVAHRPLDASSQAVLATSLVRERALVAEREDIRVRGPAPGPSRDVAPSLVSRGHRAHRHRPRRLIVPVAEELAFRGYLLRRLQAREFLTVPFERWTPWAVLVSSAAFGAIHAGWLGGTLGEGRWWLWI